MTIMDLPVMGDMGMTVMDLPVMGNMGMTVMDLPVMKTVMGVSISLILFKNYFDNNLRNKESVHSSSRGGWDKSSTLKMSFSYLSMKAHFLATFDLALEAS